jgi:hypothetical protein
VASLVVVLAMCVAGLTAMAMQVRCVDAAREAARLAARGDDRAASEAARVVGPAGAGLEIRRSDGRVTAIVSAKSTVLLGITIVAEAVAAVEPGSP